MDVNLSTEAERRAEKAEKLTAFLGVSILNIKQKVTELLTLVGRDEIFDQYTKHDISHVNKMLNILDWLVPHATKEIMTPADWLLIVLAIYFHDLGMLVTKKEYENRYNSGFTEFLEKQLFIGNGGEDYRDKVKRHYPTPSQAERFLYQEFVRFKHAERIRMWIMGKAPESLGINNEVMCEVDKLLNSLSPQFRRDIALVCESHHLEDIDNIKKYRISQPYGDSDEETANLQYAAALLRTADLLHVTSDRAPSITFQIINPTDPLSQKEWAKQKAVTRVRPQIGRDREGNLDEKALRNTIEVYATFTDVEGFFGLTSYLAYTSEQVRKTYDWISSSKKLYGSRYDFPWRYIDDSNIETEGFIRDAFEFELDQEKILDLLTGHTLYNDTNVVIRELVQNSLDAVRLQHYQNKTSEPGKVEIHWDSNERVLIVKDNGTGMTQEIIERHLLKVGSSRYQDAKFKKEYPGFSSISRFGIGVLSAFMIADSVEITTCHPEEDMIRQISLRSVHGKYLIRLLNKETDEVAKELKPHGTVFKLKVRSSVKIPNIVDIAQKWIVIPGCDVHVIQDNSLPIKIGFSSPREALEDAIRRTYSNGGELIELSKKGIKIEQTELEGMVLSYALEWSEYFQEWNFMPFRNGLHDEFVDATSKDTILLGTCIEGVRVEFETPGFDRNKILAIVNVTGPNAPKTNVARSGLEVTTERYNMLSKIYSIYCGHIKNEIQSVHQKRFFSLTWATQEAKFMLHSLVGKSPTHAVDDRLLIEEIKKLPMLLVEQDGQRQAISPSNFSEVPCFWKIECELFKSAELIIREASTDASLSALLSSLYKEHTELPKEPILCDFGISPLSLDQYVFDSREINAIIADKTQRRVNFRWVDKGTSPRWLRLHEITQSVFRINDIVRFESLVRRRRLHSDDNLFVPMQGVEFSGLTDEAGVRVSNAVYLAPNSDLVNYILKLFNEFSKDLTVNKILLLDSLAGIITSWRFFTRMDRIEKNNLLEDLKRLEVDIDLKEIVDITDSTSLKFFDPYAWIRKVSKDE